MQYIRGDRLRFDAHTGQNVGHDTELGAATFFEQAQTLENKDYGKNQI